MLTLFIVFIICVTVFLTIAMGGIGSAPSAALNTIAEICILMLCGGTAMLIELIKRIRYRNAEQLKENELEILLNTNEDIRSIFTQYSANEHSLENIKAFDMLRQFSNNFANLDKIVSLPELIKFEEEFIKTYSRFELNISGATKKKFYELIDSCKHSPSSVLPMTPTDSRESLSSNTSNTQLLNRTHGVTVAQLKEVLGLELMLNMNDTFSRLQRTQQYVEWESIYKLQHHTKDSFHP